MSCHKTIPVFKRYNLVTEEELAGIKWPTPAEVTQEWDNRENREDGSLSL